MSHNALLLIDLQNDFMPGGALSVPQGNEVVDTANKLQAYFELIIATQDWHPKNHSSFHTLWPVHCVQHTHGAALVQNLDKSKINKIIYKGTNPEIDSYSAFFDNAYQQQTDLDAYLKSQKVTDLYMMGLATDYCVSFSALDALALGYNVYLIEDGCRGIEVNTGDIQKAITLMQNQGAKIIPSSHVWQDK